MRKGLRRKINGNINIDLLIFKSRKVVSWGQSSFANSIFPMNVKIALNAPIDVPDIALNLYPFSSIACIAPIW